MKSLNFMIYKDEDGVYVANCTNAFVVTQGHTFDELLKNIREATELFFEDEKKDPLIPSPFFTITYSDKLYA